MKTTRENGFTLWELLMTLLVAGILFGVGVPSMMEFQRNGAMVAAANELVTGLLTARSEAVQRQRPVTLCASANPTAANPTCSPNGAGTNGGFIVWVDENNNFGADGAPVLTDGTDGNAVVDPGETLLMQSEAPGGTINVWADSGYVAYGPNGFRRAAAGVGFPSANWVLLCDERGNRPTSGQLSAARAVRIEPTGRGQVVQEIADVAGALADLQGSALGAAATCPP